MPFAFIDAGDGGNSAGLSGLHLSAFHNLNTETSIPALAVSATVLVPAGSALVLLALLVAAAVARRSGVQMPEVLPALALLAGSAACSDDAPAASGGVEVTAAFYPYAFLVERIGESDSTLVHQSPAEVGVVVRPDRMTSPRE